MGEALLLGISAWLLSSFINAFGFKPLLKVTLLILLVSLSFMFLNNKAAFCVSWIGSLFLYCSP